MHDPRDRPISLLIVDDHPVVRDGLRAILETEPGIAVVGQAATGREALQRYAELRPDVTLLDVHLMDESGLDVLFEIRSRNEAAAVLMISAFDHDEDMHGALKLGARGYVLKDLKADELIRAIQAAHEGGPSLLPGVGDKFGG